MKLNGTVQVYLIVISVCIVAFSQIVILPEEASAYTPHSPILIDGDVDFTVANGVTGGNGTPDDPYVIEGWEIDSLSSCVWILNTSVHFILRDMYVHSTSMSTTCIKLENVTPGTIDSTIVDLSGRGIGIFSSKNVTISGTFITSAWEGALFIWDSDNVTIVGNTLLQYRLGNLFCTSSRNITIYDNNISGDGNGITLYLTSNSTITSNTIINTTIAISVHDSSNATIVGNIIFDNAQVAELRNSYDILLYHNYFVDAKIPASDDMGPENTWDDGYPSGGNYWSDYTGIDNCSGPNQDICPDPDGIGDTPYIIDADSLDRYPLMSAPGISWPRPPTSMGASLTGMNFENVTLSWKLSLDDGTGFRSVVEYQIFRNTSYSSNGSGYGLIGSVPNGTSEFIDVSVGEGDPRDYFYRVCAVDASNNATCGDDQAGKVTRSLLKGPNIISIPLVQSDQSVEAVLQTVGFDQARSYDSSAEKWKRHMTFKPYQGDLGGIDTTMGIWVNVTQDCNLTVAGAVPTTTVIQLRAGWNLVGFPSFLNTFSVADLKMETGVTVIEGLDPMTPPYFFKQLSDVDFLRGGYGYWVYAETDTDWIVKIS